MVHVQSSYTGAKLTIRVTCWFINITQWLIATNGLRQWRYGHVVIVTEVWGSIPPANQVLNDQPTTLKALFYGVCQHLVAQCNV